MVRTLRVVLMSASTLLPVSLLLPSCGGSSSPATTVAAATPIFTAPTTAPTTAADAANEPGSGSSSNGKIDCSIKGSPRFVDLIVGLQLIAQLNSQATVDSVKTQTIGRYDPKQLASLLEALKPLGGSDYPPFGDPADSIDLYLRANEKAAELLAIDGPIPQAKFDELSAIVGNRAKFLLGKASIGEALDKACPK